MSWIAIKSYIIKTIKLRFRDRGDIFWIFIWPIILMIMSATIFVPPNTDRPITLKIGVVNMDVNSTAPFNGSLLVDIMKNVTIDNAKLFNIKSYNDTYHLVEDIYRGELDAGIYIPRGFGNDVITGQGNLTLYVYSGDLQKRQIIYGLLSQFFQRLSYKISIKKIDMMIAYIPIENVSAGYNLTANMIKRYFIGLASPLNITYNDITPESINTREKILGWLTIGDVGMVTLYTGLWLGAVTVVEEKDMKTLRRILSTPSSPSDMLIGKTIAGLIILGLSSVVTIFIGILFGADITWDIFNPIHWMMIGLFILIAIFTIGLGLILSIFTDNVKGASGLGIAVGLILSFTAGIWFPSWMLPDWMRILANNFPATWGLDTIRDILVYNRSLSESYLDIIKLGISAVITYLIGLYIFKALIRKFAER